MSFGKKGLAEEQGRATRAARPLSAAPSGRTARAQGTLHQSSSAATLGLGNAHSARRAEPDPYAAERAAFLEAERARASDPGKPDRKIWQKPDATIAEVSGPSGYDGVNLRILGPAEKRSVGLAYLFWFVLGQASGHRFYCGDTEGAIRQVGLFIASLALLFIMPPLGWLGFVGWALWIFGDLFTIPSLMAKFKARYAYNRRVFE